MGVILRSLEQLFSVASGGKVARVGPEHPTELRDHLPALEPVDRGPRDRAAAASDVLGDAEMAGPERGTCSSPSTLTR